MIGPNTTLDEVLRMGEDYAQLLNEIGFDSCCDGYKTFTDAAAEHNLDLDSALARLNALRNAAQ